MARKKFKNLVEKEYYRLRKNIINRNYRARKSGKPEITLPAIPKKITTGSINKLVKVVNTYEDKIKKKKEKEKAKKKKRKTSTAKPISILSILNDSIYELLDWAVSQITDVEIKTQFRLIVAQVKQKIRRADLETQKKYLENYSNLQKDFEAVINKYKDTNNMVGLSKLANALNKMFDTEIKIKVDRNTILNTATGEVEDL